MRLDFIRFGVLIPINELGAVRGHTIADKIEYQARVLVQVGDLLPATAPGINLVIINHRKGVVV
ncbi:hypothetical protein BBW68_10350 [Candidatus Erwinia dacicola]|uniref:Uncharacterized protein n=1 Tax=Candidatus Erwinia dacicola TaxID=252393 RepID=A0A1E7Z0F9_9GAMM|nr:hypothetical protein BBW68_10350 [Candidatus Erwinia dacicola]